MEREKQLQTKIPSANPHPNPKRSKRQGEKEFEFCKVCRLNHNQGRKHIFFPSHKKALSSFLSKFLPKVSDVSFFLKNPTLLRPEFVSRNRFWCVFCDSSIDELGREFACCNSINHLASEDHLKSLKHFLWKYGGGMDHVDSFRISQADVVKWEKRCKLLKNQDTEGSHGPTNDIQNKLNYDNVHDFVKTNVNSVEHSFSHGVLPLQYYTNERSQVSHPDFSIVGSHPHQHHVDSIMHASPNSRMGSWGLKNPTVWIRTPCDLLLIVWCLSYGLDHGEGGQSFIGNGATSWANGGASNGWVHEHEGMDIAWATSQGLQNPTHISLRSQEANGNVHTGAPPPWLEAIEVNQLKTLVNPESGIKRLDTSLNKSQKSQKLNPKRVGAAWAERRKLELEMEKRGEIVSTCGDDWLPNFGRVWQSGSRKESRKEFEKEKQKAIQVTDQSEVSIEIQPYISKR
ncbi:CCDC84-like, partial [Dillenia turbinata]